MNPVTQRCNNWNFWARHVAEGKWLHKRDDVRKRLDAVLGGLAIDVGDDITRRKTSLGHEIIWVTGL
eukprot:CAMPEP_0115854612 /NCGR_PEP_ID=MMETSP0287-20121206/14115_1 /TAXON_ID=412157 /ORGANISM="Chrysochromulina rotalis, Strain UIO044" /LENGTH=66 /DNA_ID=CAMNT_0003308737 /DNA_START=918 /DNA_END=1118 /DNA_ORIENTATION=-